MQNNSSQPKNEKSTGRKTRPTLVEKMAMLEEIYAGGEPLRFCSCNCFSNNQSINQSINGTIISWKMPQEFTSEIAPTVLIGRKKMFWCYVLRRGFSRIYVENERKEIIDWREALCSDSWQLCWRMRHLDRNQVTWPTTNDSVHSICHLFNVLTEIITSAVEWSCTAIRSAVSVSGQAKGVSSQNCFFPISVVVFNNFDGATRTWLLLTAARRSTNTRTEVYVYMLVLSKDDC